MKTALWIAAAVAALVLLWAFRKAAVSVAWWALKTPVVLAWRGICWCCKRRWSLSHKTARSVLFAVAVAVPAVMVFPGLLLLPSAVAWLEKAPGMARMFLAAGWFVPCWFQTYSYRGVVMAFLGKAWRSRGEGFGPVFRPFLIPIEYVTREEQIERFSQAFSINAETAERDGVPLNGNGSFTKKASALQNFFKMDPGQRKSGLEQWMKYFVTLEAQKLLKRDQVHADVKGIGERVTVAMKTAKVGGVLLEDYFGITVDVVVISDPEQSPGLRAAEEKKEVAQEEAKAKTIELENFNERVNSLQTATPKGQKKLSRQKAVDTVLLIDKKITKEEKSIDIGKNAADILKDIFG